MTPAMPHPESQTCCPRNPPPQVQHILKGTRAHPQSQTPSAVLPSQSLESESGPGCGVLCSGVLQQPCRQSPAPGISASGPLSTQQPVVFPRGHLTTPFPCLKLFFTHCPQKNSELLHIGYEICQDWVPRCLLQPSPPHPLATSKFLAPVI